MRMVVFESIYIVLFVVKCFGLGNFINICKELYLLIRDYLCKVDVG